MLYTKCPACGIALRRGTGNLAVCPKCLRSFRNTTNPSAVPIAPYAQSSPADSALRLNGDVRKRKLAAVLLSLAFCGLIGGLYATPLVIFFAVFLIRCVIDAAADDKAETPDPQFEAVRLANLKTPAEYRAAFYNMPLDTMPLGKYGAAAAEQTVQLENKMQALREMLGKGHPFEKNADEASRYVLANCKQVLYRLRYCDQKDPALCRAHGEYLQERLQENTKVLRDFERLIIEVTQMNDDMPAQEPCLDVLADTLQTVRTRDGALPDAYADLGQSRMRMQ